MEKNNVCRGQKNGEGKQKLTQNNTVQSQLSQNKWKKKEDRERERRKVNFSILDSFSQIKEILHQRQRLPTTTKKEEKKERSHHEMEETNTQTYHVTQKYSKK